MRATRGAWSSVPLWAPVPPFNPSVLWRGGEPGCCPRVKEGSSPVVGHGAGRSVIHDGVGGGCSVNAARRYRTGELTGGGWAESVDPGFGAVVFDLFGTLVNAPSGQERARLATELARAFGVADGQVRSALAESWRSRHEGQLTSVPEVVRDLAHRCGARRPDLVAAVDTVRAHARGRLVSESSVLAVLTGLTARGVAVAVLSDAAVETAEAWPRSALAGLVDAAFFSCREGAVKPSPTLYMQVLAALGVPAGRVLYCGDGGGDELAGAVRAGMTAVGVPHRGGATAVAYGVRGWDGPWVAGVEDIPDVVLHGMVPRMPGERPSA
ncbi:HAD family hydrolase [Streptomyces sp. NPDC051644]|uniref:HAD family hydrolase n=1 Tax=Streptomyces sp. NPDC051644 TaxID=3365666 RepID=UPI0037893BA1